MPHHIKTQWRGKMAFDTEVDGHTVRTDARPDLGDDSGPGPKKLLLTALAGCTGIDVASLLQKMRVSIEDIQMEVEADLTEEHPKVYSEIRLLYRFFGKDINREKVEKAVKLSQEKYCGVSAMLAKNCPINYRIEYLESEG